MLHKPRQSRQQGNNLLQLWIRCSVQFIFIVAFIYYIMMTRFLHHANPKLGNLGIDKITDITLLLPQGIWNGMFIFTYANVNMCTFTHVHIKPHKR